jgi:predicted site-specific integrase-resolvase
MLPNAARLEYLCYTPSMKLSQYAKQQGISYRTALRWWKAGLVNLAENDREDLLADLVSIIHSFAARLYGQRRAKRKTEAIVKQLEASS